MRIGIIGQGFVGSSIKKGMINHYPDLLTFDLKPELSMCKSLDELIEQCTTIFVCVPTPMQSNGSCYISILENNIKQISSALLNIDKSIIAILKTTIPPGTTSYFQYKYPNIKFVFNPEFLTEANAEQDFKNQNRIILGGDDNDVLNDVLDLYAKAFPFIPIVKMTSSEAEMVKYVTNTFLATKVIFANEMYEICKELEIDYDNVYKAAKLDTRLGESHWMVPGPDGKTGFSGSCFPKDIHAIRHLANESGIKTELLDAVIAKNNRVRPEKDWENLKGRAVI